MTITIINARVLLRYVEISWRPELVHSVSTQSRCSAHLRIRLCARARLATSNKANIKLFDGETGNILNRRGVERWNRNIFKAPAHAANEVLMRIDVCVETSDGARGTHLLNQVLPLKKL